MLKIQSILDTLPHQSKVMLKTEGSCVWICWQNEADPHILKLFEDFGSIKIADIGSQTLYFFFNQESTFYAMARLYIWSSQYRSGISAFAMPCELFVDSAHTLSLNIPEEFRNLETLTPETSAKIFCHPRYLSYVRQLPGISIFDSPELREIKIEDWKLISADRRLPFIVQTGWFAFLHPVGSPSDKGFGDAWDKLLLSIQPILEQNKLKSSLQGSYLSVFIANIAELRIWVREVLTVFNEIQKFSPELYWPCLSIILDKGSHNFSHNIYETIGIDWNSMSPDQMYISYKNALSLGNEYGVRDLNFSSTVRDISELCAVYVEDFSRSMTKVLFASSMLPGEKNACFYCGSGSHGARKCPTRNIPTLPNNFWRNLNDLDFNNTDTVYGNIDREVKKKGEKGFVDLIMNSHCEEGRFLKATYAINSYLQLPNLERIWNIRSREIEDLPDDGEFEKNPATNLAKRFMQSDCDINAIERECLNSLGKGQKSWHLLCLRGFINIEKQDFKGAMNAWLEAHQACTTTVHQTWILFLLARLEEIKGNYNEAIAKYTNIKALMPNWPEPFYRILVCQVKQGLGQKVAPNLLKMVEALPEIMHKIVLDPELYRGQAHILDIVSPIWDVAQLDFAADRERLEELLGSLKIWFDDKDTPLLYYGRKIQGYLEKGMIKNYLLFAECAKLRPQVEKDLQRVINKEVSTMKQEYENCLKQVEVIRDEMNWFYFQKSLINFNNAFNDCAQILNWAFSSNFSEVEVFKEAKQKLPVLKDHVKDLKIKLTKLRMVRDITLFSMLMLKSFMRTFTVIGIATLVAVFGVLFFGQYIGFEWLQDIIKLNFWEILKVVLGIVLMVSFGLSMLKTTVIFDSRKKKMLDKAKEERLKIQQNRIDAAKKRRQELDEKKGKVKVFGN